MQIDADNQCDEDDESAGEMFQDGPERRAGNVSFRILDEEPGDGGVESGHFINVGEKRRAGDVSGPDARRRDDIHRDVQKNHEENDVAHGFGEIRRFVADGVGGMAVNENGEGAADISCIGIGAGGAENAALAAAEAEETGDEKGNRRHGDEEQNFRYDELPRFAAGTVSHHGEENKAGQHDVNDKFVECGKVEMKFRVQPKSDSDKKEERQDVVAKNGKYGHGESFHISQAIFAPMRFCFLTVRYSIVQREKFIKWDRGQRWEAG